FLQRKSFDHLTETVGELSLASVASLLADEPGEPLTAILTGPAAGRAKGDASVASHASQGDPFLQEGPKEVESLEGLGALGLRETAERGLRHRRDGSSGTAEDGESIGSPRLEPVYGRPCQIAPKKPRHLPSKLTE